VRSQSVFLITLGVTLLSAISCTQQVSPAAGKIGAKYLYVWAGPNTGARSSAHDFLSVVDADPASRTYGSVLTSLDAGAEGRMAHHMELSVSESKSLFASDFMTGQVFIIDLHDPAAPRLSTRIDSVPRFREPHSFARTQGGHVLVSMQYGNGKLAGNPGGLAEFDDNGHLIRTSSAADASFPAARIRPNGIELMPQIDRILTTSMPMDDEKTADVIQVWRLSDLHLLHTIAMPKGDSLNAMPYDSRVLADGRTAMVNSYFCGLFRVSGIESNNPRIDAVGKIGLPGSSGCAVATVIGHYWIVPDAYGRAVVSFDVSDPAHPKQVSMLSTDSAFFPHWIAADKSTNRIVVNTTDDGNGRVLIANVDSATGALTIDRKFRQPGASVPGLNFAGMGSGKEKTMAHSAVFSLPSH
jgi:hypothetical protein